MPEPSPRAVLVIDDDVDALDSMVTILTESGYIVSTATTGHEALTLLSHYPRPDLILLDLVMPHVDGVAFRWEQLSNARIADVPVVLVSATDNCSRHAGPLRVQGSLSKPFGARDLLQEVDRVLRSI